MIFWVLLLVFVDIVILVNLFLLKLFRDFIVNLKKLFDFGFLIIWEGVEEKLFGLLKKIRMVFVYCLVLE